MDGNKSETRWVAKQTSISLSQQVLNLMPIKSFLFDVCNILVDVALGSKMNMKHKVVALLVVTDEV